MAKFFKVPFATDGDRTEIPEAAQPDGAVSYTDGWTLDYQLDPEDPDVKYPERDKMNQFFYDVSDAIKQYQTFGFPDFITSSDNGGSPYSYSINAFVRYSGSIYYSLENSNTAEPSDASKWAQFAPFVVPTGVIWEYDAATLPSGWLWADGRTIGSASSGGTARANSDTQALFIQIWTDFPNSIRPIQDSSGSPTSRGASAAADFAANKRLPVADRRGRIGVGKDNMGGTAADRITEAGSGIAGTTLGATGGAQNVVLTEANLAAHTHGAGTLSTASAGSHAHGGATVGHALTPSEGPSHTHLCAASSSAVDPLQSTTPISSTTIGGSLRGVQGGTATVGVSSSPSGGGNGAAHSHSINTDGTHTHTMSGAVSSTGSSSAHLNVQPCAITNYIIKL